MDATDRNYKFKEERIPYFRIKQPSAVPSLKLISVIAISLVIIFCVFSVIQISQLTNDIYALRCETIAIQEEVNSLESASIVQNYRMSSNADIIPEE